MAKSMRKRFRWVYVLLLVPLIAFLWVPFYARQEPSWLDIPFFYWYQTLWVVLTTITMGVVYLVLNRGGR